MKKYITLAVCTALALATLVGVRLVRLPDTVSVQVVTLQPQTVRQTVECTGKVQTTDSKEVYVELPCVAQQVFVAEGDTVRQGDPLFAVDVEATQQVLANGSVSLPTDALPNTLRTTVTAPVSGTVSALSVTPGELAETGKPCAVIATGDGLQIAVAVRERDIAKLAVGQPAVITGVAFAKKQYHGTVTHIARTAHQQYIGTTAETVVDAVVVLDETELDDSLRTGLNARAAVEVDTVENALLIPYTCLSQTEEGKEFVYVYQADGTATRVFPTLGADYTDGVLAVSGLAAGAQLVQNPEPLSGETVAVRVVE